MSTGSGTVPVGGGSVQGEADTEGGAGAQKGAGQPSGSLRLGAIQIELELAGWSEQEQMKQ